MEDDDSDQYQEMASDEDGREVNAKHLLNYESDSSNDNLGEDSDDFD